MHKGLAPALASYLLTSEQDQLQGAVKPTCKPTLVQLADLAAAFVSLGSGYAGLHLHIGLLSGKTLRSPGCDVKCMLELPSVKCVADRSGK